MEILIAALITLFLYGIYKFFRIICKGILYPIRYTIKKIRDNIERRKEKIKSEKEKLEFLNSLIPEEERDKMINSILCLPQKAKIYELEEYLFFDMSYIELDGSIFLQELSWIVTNINGDCIEAKTFINSGKEIYAINALNQFCESVNKVKYVITYSDITAGVFYKLVNQYRATPIRRDFFPPVSTLENICSKYDRFPKNLTLTKIIEIIIFNTLYYKTNIPGLTTEKRTVLIYRAFMGLKKNFNLTNRLLIEKKHYHVNLNLNIQFHKKDKSSTNQLPLDSKGDSIVVNNDYEIRDEVFRMDPDNVMPVPKKHTPPKKTSRKRSGLSFVAIDFETATPHRYSACQLGVVVVEKGKIIDEREFLIQPPNNEYNFMTSIHGISEKDTINEKNFAELWPEIRPYINGRTLVCHNESFDIRVLEKTCEYYHIEDLELSTYICTLDLTGLPLIEACQALDVSVDGHHNALCDARMCAEVYLNLASGKKIDESKIKVRKGGKKGHDIDFVKRASMSESNFFNGKTVVVTGSFGTVSKDDLKEILVNKGALLRSSVSSKTQYIIAGVDPGPVKMKKATELKYRGYDLIILTEDDVITILGMK